MKDIAILDCYTVEPSGLGVPPYLSTYVRDAFCALRRAYPEAPVRNRTVRIGCPDGHHADVMTSRFGRVRSRPGQRTH